MDVGQGASHLILLGRGEAIVVDGGPATENVLLRALVHYSVDRIRRLIVSHSDGDHSRGVTRVLTTHAESIDEVWFPYDSGTSTSPFYRRARDLVREGRMEATQLVRAERDNSPRLVYEDTQQSLRLSIVSPFYFENMEANERGDANATSAIVVLDAHDSRIVFSGDATIGQWRSLQRNLGGPLTCNVVSAPHHGGYIGQSSIEDLQWLYSECIQPRSCVISVGTSNSYRHPNPEVVSALLRGNAAIHCTQITEQCCGQLEAVRNRPLVPLEPVRHSTSDSKSTRAGRSTRVACAGTIVVDIDERGCVVRNATSHEDGVNRLASEPHGTPMCRRN